MLSSSSLHRSTPAAAAGGALPWTARSQRSERRAASGERRRGHRATPDPVGGSTEGGVGRRPHHHQRRRASIRFVVRAARRRSPPGRSSGLSLEAGFARIGSAGQRRAIFGPQSIFDDFVTYGGINIKSLDCPLRHDKEPKRKLDCLCQNSKHSGNSINFLKEL